MAGRGVISEAPPIDNERLYVLRNGRWRGMYRPVNPDRVFSGVNLAESFADRYSREHNVDVGLIPCADGGTCLDQWVPGGLLFDHACYMAELASRTSTIAGVLWHQGESDCWPDRYPLYEEKLTEIIAEFRRRLDLYDVPFLLGGLGDYLAENTSRDYMTYTHINDQLRRIAEKLPMTGYVPADGLGSKPDLLHFSTEALLEFGLRYYDVFSRLEDKTKVFTERSTMDSAIRTSIESL